MDAVPVTAGLGAGHSPKAGRPSKAEWTMSDTLREQVEGYARADAARGVYMGKEFMELRKAEVAKAAPDRAALKKAAADPSLLREIREGDERMLRLRFGLSREDKYSVRGCGSALHLYNEDGEEVLTYTAGAGWQEKESPEETAVHRVLKAVYYDAYHAARQAMAGEFPRALDRMA